MIVLAVAFDQFRLKILADFGEDAGQVANGGFGQSITPVFGDKDQVRVKGANNVPSFTYFGVFRHVAPR